MIPSLRVIEFYAIPLDFLSASTSQKSDVASSNYPGSPRFVSVESLITGPVAIISFRY